MFAKTIEDCMKRAGNYFHVEEATTVATPLYEVIYAFENVYGERRCYENRNRVKNYVTCNQDGALT